METIESIDIYQEQRSEDFEFISLDECPLTHNDKESINLGKKEICPTTSERIKNKNLTKIKKSQPIICMLGKTGEGKSSLCNALIKYDPQSSREAFKIAGRDQNKSCTSKIQIKTDCFWFDGEGQVTLVDIPGMLDSSGDVNDQKCLDNLFVELKKMIKVDQFILVLKKGVLDSKIQEMIEIYQTLLGSQTWKYFTVVITNADFDSDEYQNIDQYEEFLNELKKSFMKTLTEKYNITYTLNVIPISLKKLYNGGEMNEIWKKSQFKALKEIKQIALSSIGYRTFQVQKVLTKATQQMFKDLYKSYGNQVKKDLEEFLTGYEIKKELLQLLNKVSQQDKDKLRIDLQSFMKYLIDNTKADFLKLISLKCKEILEKNISNFKEEVSRWLKNAEKIDLVSSNLQVNSIEEEKQLLIITSCLALAAATMSIFIVPVAIFGAIMIVKSNWTREEAIEKVAEKMLNDISKKQNNFLSSISKSWKGTFEEAKQQSQQRSDVLEDFFEIWNFFDKRRKIKTVQITI